MRLDQFQSAAIRGLYTFVSYPVKVTLVAQGAYVPGQGAGPMTCTTHSMQGFVTNWKRTELEGSDVPFTAAKLVLMKCDASNFWDPECARCFEPTCGPFAGTKFRLWRGAGGAFLERDAENVMLSFAVVAV